jgi:predicted transcriptional regulator
MQKTPMNKEKVVVELIKVTGSIWSALHGKSSQTFDELLDIIVGNFNAYSSKDCKLTRTPFQFLPPLNAEHGHHVEDKDGNITCRICGKGFKVLKRHLMNSHKLDVETYKRMFSVPASDTLTSLDYSNTRSQIAKSLGLGTNKNKAGRRANNTLAKG